MQHFAIKVDNLSKLYRIGPPDEVSSSLIKKITNTITSPFKYLKQSLTPPNENEFIWALKNVSFNVMPGEVVGIIGPNGAGKSTLLKILSQITEPSKGFAQINGRVSSLLEVGTGFHPELTGKENIFLNGAILGMKKWEINKKLNDIIEFSGIEKFLNTPVKRYSSGMKVRLAFSVAAHLEPEILIIDEVLAVGDIEFQKKCLGKMENINESGRTILFVSHNMSAITRICNRALLIKNGGIVDDGPAPKVVGSYIQSHVGTSAIRKWDNLENAPGDDVIRLQKVSVQLEDGTVTNQISITKKFYICLTYTVLKSGKIVTPAIQLINDEDVLIFGALDTDKNWKDAPKSKGTYISKSTIPGNLLSDGHINIFVSFFSSPPLIKHVVGVGNISLQIVEPHFEDTARGRWLGEMRGSIRPLLEWNTVKIE